MKTDIGMKRVACLLTLGLLTPACGLFASAQPGAHVASAESVTATPAAHVEGKAPSDTRKVGDFAVHRFSGSYQKAPLTMTEEVIANEDGLWVIDYTLEEQAGTSKLRVRFDPHTDSVVRVSKLDGANEIALPTSAYDNMIERTSFAADSNDGEVASTHGTCLVGPNELDCETKSYKVWVGEQQATLNVSHSASLPNGDVSGDITTSDGTLIYRSELVEMGNSAAPKLGVASR
jgi:hypothetical protein